MGGVSLAAQKLGLQTNLLEGLADADLVALSRVGQADSPAMPLDEGDGEPFFEFADLVADRGMRNAQLVRGNGDAAQPRDGFKRA